MFVKLDSKLCMATVLGYLLSWEQAKPFFTCLNTKGPAYFAKHESQFRHFINDAPSKELAVTFGDKTSQFMRPNPFAWIPVLQLKNVKCDLNQIESFAENIMQVGTFSINENF